MTQRRRGALALALALICTSTATACTSRDSSSPRSEAAKPVSGAAAVVQAAKAELANYSGMPRFVAPNSAFDTSSLKGRTVAIVAVNQTTPSLVEVAAAVKQAAAAAGLKTTMFDANNAPNLMTGGVQQAIVQKADAIVLDGIPVDLVSTELKAAATAKIPVINVNNSEPDASKPGQGAGGNIYATSAQDFTLFGRLAADGAIVRTGGAAKVVLVNTSGITPSSAVMAGFKSALGDCSTCKIVDTRDVQLQDWTTGLVSLTTSIINADRSANVILPIFATMALFIVPAVQQAGAASKVSVFSTSAAPDEAKLMLANPSLGGLAGNSESYLGWLTVNQAMRGMLGLKPGNPVVPGRWITASLVKKVGSSDSALYGTDFLAGFKKLWHIS